MIDDSSSSQARGLVRPALSLAGCVVTFVLVFLPFAWGNSGLNGPIGLVAAAAICLAAGWVAEAMAFSLRGSVTPLGIMLLGMAVRLAPPLGICLILAVQGASGRQHLAFIVYLLTLYLATLALETWLMVKRVGREPSDLNHNVR